MIASGKDRTACSPGRQTLEEKKDRKKTKTEILHSTIPNRNVYVPDSMIDNIIDYVVSPGQGWKVGTPGYLRSA